MQLLRKRRGSVPVVLIVVILLGIGAAASLFSTMNDARMNSRAQLNVFAKMLAQSAVEEMLIKITNNSADFGLQNEPGAPTEGIRYKFDPIATRFFAHAQADGMPRFNVAPVEIMGRSIVDPEDPAEYEHFKELVTAGPNFASNSRRTDVYGTDDAHWHYLDPATGNWNEALANGSQDMPENIKKMLDPAGPWKTSFSSLVKPIEGHGEEYLENEWEGTYKDRTSGWQDGGNIRNGFSSLPVLSDKWGWVDDRAGIKNYCHFSDCELEGDPDAANPNGTMDNFIEKWDETMDSVADRVADRIAGCAGNPNYGIGAMLSAIVLGGASDADSTAEEEFRETAEAGGVTEYQAYLVSVYGKAYTASDMPLQVQKSITAHRIVSKMKLGEAMEGLRNTTIPYLISHYNFTPQDLVVLGWATPMEWASGNDLDTGPADENDHILIGPKPEIFSKLTERYPDNPNPRVVPFQAATCVGAIQDS